MLPLDQAEDRILWRALWTSRWTVPGQFRRTLCHFPLPPPTAHGVDAVQAFLDGAINPPVVLQVVDELRKEAKLSKQVHSAITEKILHRVTAEGQWC